MRGVLLQRVQQTLVDDAVVVFVRVFGCKLVSGYGKKIQYARVVAEPEGAEQDCGRYFSVSVYPDINYVAEIDFRFQPCASVGDQRGCGNVFSFCLIVVFSK